MRSQGTQTLTISVEDNGRGLPPELMGPYTGPPETSGRGHLGLYNVDTILKKHYGEAYGLRLGSRPGGPGAAVTASLPLRKEEELSLIHILDRRFTAPGSRWRCRRRSSGGRA